MTTNVRIAQGKRGTSQNALPRYIAFLRAVNVGGRIVKMEQLRRELAALGFSGVQTLIASGNVIFEARAQQEHLLQRKIESQLRKGLGYEVAVFIRSPSELIEIVRHEPFPREDLHAPGHALYVALLSARPSAEAEKNLIACRNEGNDFHVHGREIYWLCRTRMSDSNFTGARLEKITGMQTTVRNITTIRRLITRHLPDQPGA